MVFGPPMLNPGDTSERRVDFFGRCFAVPRKLSRGPQKDRGTQFEKHWFRLYEMWMSELAYLADIPYFDI